APEHEQPQERPYLGSSQSREHGEYERPAVAAEQSHVERGQGERDQHRVRLRALDVVEVVLNPEYSRPGDEGGGVGGEALKRPGLVRRTRRTRRTRRIRRTRATPTPAAQPERDPGAEYRAGQGDRA